MAPVCTESNFGDLVILASWSIRPGGGLMYIVANLLSHGPLAKESS